MCTFGPGDWLRLVGPIGSRGNPNLIGKIFQCVSVHDIKACSCTADPLKHKGLIMEGVHSITPNELLCSNMFVPVYKGNLLEDLMKPLDVPLTIDEEEQKDLKILEVTS